MHRLPREVVGVYFPKLFVVDMHAFEPEMILPGLFYLIRMKGRERGTRTEATDTLAYARAFAEHARVEGFDKEVGLRLAHKWSRTSFARIGRVGRGKKGGEQITHLTPLSFLTYKPAFPTQISRHRNVHRFLFDLMFRAGDGQMTWSDMLGNKADTEPPLAALLRQAFSFGVEFTSGRELDAYYDGKTPLDTEILASMYYTDGFAPVPPSPRRFTQPPAPALTGAARSIVRDVQCFVTAYATRMPTVVLAKHLTALIALELAAYTFRLFSSVNELFTTGNPPAEMLSETATDASYVNVYCDLTEDRRSVSSEIARQCVARDLESIEQYFVASLTLRTIDRFIESIGQLRDRLGAADGPDYLVKLPSYREELAVEIAAGQEIQRITDTWAKEGTDEAQGLPQMDGSNDFERLADLLVKVQRSKGVANMTEWYRSICGLEKDYGLLSGSLGHRSTWLYTVSHSLLETLVQLCVVLPEYRPFSQMRAGRDLSRQLEPMPVLLSDFLRFLRERFGILIDRPPDFRQDAGAQQAARTNLAAFKERLRQMGLFMDLSDDFNAQHIYPRFKERIRDFEAEDANAILRGRE